jgi:hypothetical protein
MKFKLLAVAFLLVSLVTGCADRKPRRGDDPPTGLSMGRENPQQMADDLGLNEDQKKKYLSIMKSHGEKMRALHSRSSMSPEDRRSKAMALHDKLVKEMQGLLTPEQFSQWQQARQALRARSGEGGGAPQEPGPQGGGTPPGPGYAPQSSGYGPPQGPGPNVDGTPPGPPASS